MKHPKCPGGNSSKSLGLESQLTSFLCGSEVQSDEGEEDILKTLLKGINNPSIFSGHNSVIYFLQSEGWPLGGSSVCSLMLLMASLGLGRDGVACWLGHLGVLPVVSYLLRAWPRHFYNMVSPGVWEDKGGSCDHVEALKPPQHQLPHIHQLEQGTVVPKFRGRGKGS